MYATYMLNSGGDLAAVSAMLGHSSVSLTADVYYQSMTKEKQRAANLLPKLYEDGDPHEKYQRLKEKKGKVDKPKKKKMMKVKHVGYISDE